MNVQRYIEYFQKEAEAYIQYGYGGEELGVVEAVPLEKIVELLRSEQDEKVY